MTPLSSQATDSSPLSESADEIDLSYSRSLEILEREDLAAYGDDEGLSDRFSVKEVKVYRGLHGGSLSLIGRMAGRRWVSTAEIFTDAVQGDPRFPLKILGEDLSWALGFGFLNDDELLIPNGPEVMGALKQLGVSPLIEFYNVPYQLSFDLPAYLYLVNFARRGGSSIGLPIGARDMVLVHDVTHYGSLFLPQSRLAYLKKLIENTLGFVEFVRAKLSEYPNSQREVILEDLSDIMNAAVEFIDGLTAEPFVTLLNELVLDRAMGPTIDSDSGDKNDSEYVAREKARFVKLFSMQESFPFFYPAKTDYNEELDDSDFSGSTKYLISLFIESLPEEERRLVSPMTDFDSYLAEVLENRRQMNKRARQARADGRVARDRRLQAMGFEEADQQACGLILMGAQ